MSTSKFKVGDHVVGVDPKGNSTFFYDNTRRADEASLKELPVRRMEAHKTAYRAEQERAIGGGLQKHSIGDIYPLAAVGYGSGEGVAYTLENLQTGEVCMAGSWVRQWGNAKHPLEFAKVIGTKRGVSWKHGRPVFDSDGKLHLPPRPIKDFEVTLLAAIAEYQRALEQDIG